MLPVSWRRRLWRSWTLPQLPLHVLSLWTLHVHHRSNNGMTLSPMAMAVMLTTT
jgi:hypothetical protein